MAMPGRTQPPSGVAGYRYAHNGQEKDNEIFDGALSAEFWEYDSRLGRRWEMDPITNASESSYATFANNPIAASDPDGLAPKWLKDIGRFFKNPFKYKKHRYTNFKNGGNKHTNHIGKAFMKVVGIGRKIFTGAKTARRLIPQGHDNYRIVDISGQNVQPGSEGPSDNVKQAIDQDLASNGIQSPFAKKVVGIYGGVWNGDAAIDPATGQLVNGGDIGGFVSVEGIVSGSGWHSLFMNTGFRGFMQTRAKTPNLGFVDIGSERIPFFNFVDDALGNIFGFLKGLGIANKQTTWFSSTTAIRVVNSKFTKHAVDYSFGIKYKYWSSVQALNHKKDNTRSQRSKLFQMLHNVTK